MHMRLKVSLILATFFLVSLSSFTQEQAKAAPTSKRSKIGLVFQGGGALGLAHVGVITWLEEHHIPVDYIAGTSMGGLVGGVYATGHNAAEMRQIVNGIPWDEVMAGVTPFPIFRSAARRTPAIIPTAWSLACVRVCSSPPASIPANRSLWFWIRSRFLTRRSRASMSCLLRSLA